MKRFKILLLVLWCSLLLFLAAASFTNLIFDENEEKVYNVTVVLEDDQKPLYENMKAGIRKALEGTGVKIYYLNLSGKDQAEICQSLEEQCREKDMVIVKCDSNPLLEPLLKQCDTRQKVICLNADDELSGILCNIHTDEYSRGESLAQRIEKEQGEDCILYVFGSAYEKLHQDVCALGLLGSNLKVIACLERSEEEICERLASIEASGENAAAVSVKTEFMKELAECQTKTGTEIPLYGFGYDKEIIKLMEDDKIQAVNVVSDYSMGYMSMKTAALAIDGKLDYQEQVLESYTVGRDEIFSEKYENILFP